MNSKKYFCFSIRSFKSSNRFSGGYFDYKQFITDIDEKQLKEYSKYDNFEFFESEADCINFASKFAKDYKEYILQKEIDLKQSFLDTFSKEFCDYVFLKFKRLSNNHFEYFAKNIQKSDYLLGSLLFTKEHLHSRLKERFEALNNFSLPTNTQTIFDIKNNQVCSVELKFEITPLK